MAYSPTTWQDGTTPLNAANLNKLENGVAELDETLSTQNVFAAGTVLTAGTNLDEITAYGRYNVSSSSVASSVENTPMTSSGYALFVFPSGGQRTQLAVMGGQNNAATANWIYLRNMNSSGTWTGWYVIAGTLT